MKSILKNTPAVFAVGNNYQIIVPVKKESVMWVQIGDKCFYDESNGILCSAKGIHRMTVPCEVLNEAGQYSVCYRRIIKRKPYFSVTHSVQQQKFTFRKVPEGRATAYQIADAHNMIDEPVAAAKKFIEGYGKIDFLILNGDVPEDSGKIKNFDTIYEICSRITKGEIPVVFSRGNHDTRGIYAEKIAEYTPCENGNSYFTFKIGGVFGIVLDCGEDKPDNHEEYGNMVACEFFRKKETAFLEKLSADFEAVKAEANPEHIIVVAHNPFTRRYPEPFNIEEDTYAYWSRLLKEKIRPEIMICGHIHKFSVDYPGCDKDAFGQPCPVVVGSQVDKHKRSFAGSGFIFEKDNIQIIFNDDKEIIETHNIKL